MLGRMPWGVGLLAGAMLVLGCSHQHAEVAPAVHGVVVSAEKVMLPPNAELRLELVEVTRTDAPDFQMVARAIPVSGELPIRFELPYDRHAIHARHQYELQTKVVADGQVVLVNVKPQPLFTGDAPSDNVQILVRPARLGRP